MDLKRIAQDTAKTLSSYLTYQAVKVVVGQLSETDPPRAFWLNRFSTTAKIQDGDVYIQNLLRESQELAFRIMTVREHLANEVADFLPEMVRTAIQEANMDHRRQYLERITQLDSSSSIAGVDPSADPEPDSDTPSA